MAVTDAVVGRAAQQLSVAAVQQAVAEKIAHALGMIRIATA